MSMTWMEYWNTWENNESVSTLDLSKPYLVFSKTITGAELNSGTLKTTGGFAFSPDGTCLASAVNNTRESAILLWNLPFDGRFRKLTGRAGNARFPMSRCRTLAFLPDGKTLISGHERGELKFWDITRLACKKTIQAHDNIRTIAISPDGTQVLSSCYAPKYCRKKTITLTLWEASSGARRHDLKNSSLLFDNFAFSPTRSEVAIGHSNGSIWLWDPTTYEYTKDLGIKNKCGGYGFDSLVYSPDGTRLLSSGRQSGLKLWDTTNWQCIRTLPNRVAAFSPNSRQVITRTNDGFTIWDSITGKRLCDHKIGKYNSRGVAFSPDNTQLALFKSDPKTGCRMAKLWNIMTPTPVQDLKCDYSLTAWLQSILSKASLDSHQSLETLKLNDIPLSNEAFKLLVKILKIHPTLTCVDLSGSGVTKTQRQDLLTLSSEGFLKSKLLMREDDLRKLSSLPEPLLPTINEKTTLSNHNNPPPLPPREIDLVEQQNQTNPSPKLPPRDYDIDVEENDKKVTTDSNNENITDSSTLIRYFQQQKNKRHIIPMPKASNTRKGEPYRGLFNENNINKNNLQKSSPESNKTLSIEMLLSIEKGSDEDGDYYLMKINYARLNKTEAEGLQSPLKGNFGTKSALCFEHKLNRLKNVAWLKFEELASVNLLINECRQQLALNDTSRTDFVAKCVNLL